MVSQSNKSVISTGKKGWKYFKRFSYSAYGIDDRIKKKSLQILNYLVFLMYLEVFHLILDYEECKSVLLILDYIYKPLLIRQPRDEQKWSLKTVGFLMQVSLLLK